LIIISPLKSMDENSSINSRKFIPLHLGRIQVCVYRTIDQLWPSSMMVWWWINISIRIEREKRAWTESMIQMTSIKSHNFIHFFVVVSFISTLWYHWTVIYAHTHREPCAYSKKIGGRIHWRRGNRFDFISRLDSCCAFIGFFFFALPTLYDFLCLFRYVPTLLLAVITFNGNENLFFLDEEGTGSGTSITKCNKPFNGWRTRFRESECSI
jgi:hypothetical protein